jgi:hypothetical protein
MMFAYQPGLDKQAFGTGEGCSAARFSRRETFISDQAEDPGGLASMPA